MFLKQRTKLTKKEKHKSSICVIYSLNITIVYSFNWKLLTTNIGNLCQKNIEL